MNVLFFYLACPLVIVGNTKKEKKRKVEVKVELHGTQSGHPWAGRFF